MFIIFHLILQSQSISTNLAPFFIGTEGGTEGISFNLASVLETGCISPKYYNFQIRFDSISIHFSLLYYLFFSYHKQTLIARYHRPYKHHQEHLPPHTSDGHLSTTIATHLYRNHYTPS
ncbi:hypothetical protein LXL04_012374 [Taraxacum kok-saghyz]